MAAKFHERFEIKVGAEEAKQRFVNRVHNLVFDHFWPNFQSDLRNHLHREIITALGDKVYLSYSLSERVGEDFYRNIQAIEAFYRAMPSLYRNHLPVLEQLIHRLLEESEVDLGIRWENGQFVKSGAMLL